MKTPEFDFVILGAGISGLVCAAKLAEQPDRRIAIIDEYTSVGGNHISREICGYTFDIGCFIFQDDSPLLKYYPELMQLYIPIELTVGRLNPQGQVTKYPLSVRTDVVDAGVGEWVKILISLMRGRATRREISNASDFTDYWLGRYFSHRSGLRNYMERFYGVPADQIDIRFAEKRMQWIREHASLANPALRRPIRRGQQATNRQLVRPRQGFAHLYHVATESLQRRGIKLELGSRLKEIHRADDKTILEVEGRTYAAKRVISTIPLETTLALCGINPGRPLEAVKLISLFFSFLGTRGFAQPVLYNFAHDGAWKRLTVYSDFYGRNDGREFFAVETNAVHVDGSLRAAEEDFRRHISKNGLFAGDLRLEGANELAQAYPIYTKGAAENAAQKMASLREFGIEPVGRQGAFDYQPSARDSTLKAEESLRQMFNEKGP